jgi:hypothetical protein
MQNVTGTFRGKRYVRVFYQSKSGQLKLGDRLLWAFLVRKVRYKGGMTAAALARVSGLSRQRGVASGLRRMRELGLVVYKGQRWYAVKPPVQLHDWFVPRLSHSGDWFERLAYFKVYRPERDGALDMRQAAVLGVLMADNINPQRQTAKGLATILGCDARTVAKALAALCELGLVIMRQSKIRKVVPDPSFFQNKKGKAKVNDKSPSRTEKIRQEIDMATATAADWLRQRMKQLKATDAEIKEALTLIKSVNLDCNVALSLLESANRKDNYGTPIKLFMSQLRSKVQERKDLLAQIKPMPLVRTEDYMHRDYWKARVNLSDAEAGEIVRMYSPEQLHHVGRLLVPHYDEDQPGDKYEQMDAAEAKRLSRKELLSRLK